MLYYGHCKICGYSISNIISFGMFYFSISYQHLAFTCCNCSLPIMSPRYQKTSKNLDVLHTRPNSCPIPTLYRVGFCSTSYALAWDIDVFTSIWTSGTWAEIWKVFIFTRRSDIECAVVHVACKYMHETHQCTQWSHQNDSVCWHCNLLDSYSVGHKWVINLKI